MPNGIGGAVLDFLFNDAEKIYEPMRLPINNFQFRLRTGQETNTLTENNEIFLNDVEFYKIPIDKFPKFKGLINNQAVEFVIGYRSKIYNEEEEDVYFDLFKGVNVSETGVDKVTNFSDIETAFNNGVFLVYKSKIEVDGEYDNEIYKLLIKKETQFYMIFTIITMIKLKT